MTIVRQHTKTLKAKTREQIAQEYGINRRTLYRWLKKENLDFSSGILTPEMQNAIYEKFGNPLFHRANL